MLAVASLPDSECSALSIYVPAGSRDEAGLPAGLAHFAEHMSFKGTALRSSRELTLEIENAGGQINACTSEEHTVYEGRGDSELMPLLADVLADMVWNSTFPDPEIALEREVIGEEITMYRESPADHIGDLISEALWDGHPLGHPISGSMESIEQITREHLLAFRDRHHLRQDVVISASGPFGLDEVHEMLRNYLPKNQFSAKTTPVAFDRARAIPRTVKDTRETDQLQLALAWHTPGRLGGSRHALRLLSMMLGESASSRLFLELREERGLCYQIGTDVTLFQETGAFEVSAGLDPEAREEAVKCILREIDDLVEHGPRPGELARAKRLTIAQSKLAFESTGAHAAWAGEWLVDYGHIPEPAAWREKLMAVRDEDVQAAAMEIFRGSEPSVAEIGEETT